MGPARKPRAESARGLAARVLARVFERGVFLDVAMADLSALDAHDRGLVLALCRESLRRLGQLDAMIDGFTPRPLPSEAMARHVLRLVVAEVVFLSGPPHAAVDAAVSTIRRYQPHQAGLVNAVARRLCEQGAALAPKHQSKAMPIWLRQRLTKAWGKAGAEAIALAHLREAPLDLTPREAQRAPELAKLLGAQLLPTGSLRLMHPGRVSELPGYESGEWWVQDAAAALPVRLLGPVQGLRVLDLCAAPGGKTLQLAALGAQVTAVDIDPLRLARLRDNLARTGLRAQLLTLDALRDDIEGVFDAILLDAPCSASGTLRRHPDGAHLKTGQGIETLVATQRALLARAARWLKPGGRLVYCTCSLFPEEGEAIAADPGPGWRLMPISDPVLKPFLDVKGCLRTRPDDWPEFGGLDGFFAACLSRLPS